MKKTFITPAALRAIADGNLDNFIAASTPGGIEAQEKAGQSDLVHSSQLPKDGCDRAQLETLGFTFGDDVDDLFVNVKFPPGWKLNPTDHSMWSELIDENGTVRGSVFYKAAFYDRRAFIRMN